MYHRFLTNTGLRVSQESPAGHTLINRQKKGSQIEILISLKMKKELEPVSHAATEDNNIGPESHRTGLEPISI